MERETDYINALKNIMKTLDGRDFIYNFILQSCGVDLSSGVPTTNVDEFTAGRRKPGIDLFNLLFVHCGDDLRKMITEQKLLTQKGEKNGNEY